MWQAARHCQHLDVRVLLSCLKYANLNKIQTQRAIDLVIFDREFQQDEIERFLATRIANKTENCGTVTLKFGGDYLPSVEEVGDEMTYKHCVLGGTFDRLHLAHKLLLSEAALRAKEKVTVGVTEENMLHSMLVCESIPACFYCLCVADKTLWELIEPIKKRTDCVRIFLTDICPELDVRIVAITDPFGPAKDDPTMDLIVVSKETVRGGQKINEGDSYLFLAIFVLI